MMEKPRAKLIGERACILCALPVRVYAQKNGHLGYSCQSPGCRCQIIGKSEKADGLIAAGITLWFHAEDRAAYMGEPKPAPKPSPRPQKVPPVRKPAPPAAKPAEDREARTRRELFGEGE